MEWSQLLGGGVECLLWWDWCGVSCSGGGGQNGGGEKGRKTNRETGDERRKQINWISKERG